MAVAAQVEPHLAGTEPARQLLPLVLGLDQRDDLLVTLSALGRAPVAGLVVSARSDLDARVGQDAADRLDSERLLVGLDVVDQDR